MLASRRLIAGIVRCQSAAVWGTSIPASGNTDRITILAPGRRAFLLPNVELAIRFEVCARPPRGCGDFRHFRQLIIYLFFEVVHFAGFHAHAVPQLKDPAGAAADESSAGTVELVKVVTHAGEGH
jgi:hypothetical protein